MAQRNKPWQVDKAITSLAIILQESGAFKNMKYAFLELLQLHANGRFTNNNDKIQLGNYPIRIMANNFLD